MATPGSGCVAALGNLDTGVLLGSKVDNPEVVELVVVVVLASEDIALVIEDNRRVRCPNAWLIGAILADLLPLNSVSLLASDVALVNSGSLHESSENDE